MIRKLAVLVERMQPTEDGPLVVQDFLLTISKLEDGQIYS